MGPTTTWSGSLALAASDPLSEIHQLAGWLAASAVKLVLAMALGAALARAMRARHLHWSWAALAGVALVPVRDTGGDAGSVLVLASLWAALRGRRWHRDDLCSGADLAEIARRRTSPLHALERLGRAAGARLAARRPWGGAADRRDRLTLGVDARRRVVSIPFARRGGSHTLVVGATGSGKTVTQTAIAVQAVARGMALVVVDPKGDHAMCERVAEAARDAGREPVVWTPRGGCVYNPCARGDASEVADKVLAGERFTEPHYLRQAQRFVGHVVRALRGAGVEVSLASLAAHLAPERLELLARALPEAAATPVFSYLDLLSPRQGAELAGVRDRLAILAESDVGRWLDPGTPAEDRLDLLDAVRRRGVVYFNLESDRRPLVSQMLAAAIVQDLQTVVASLQGEPVPTLLAIDEFSAVAVERVVRLFARARSAGFSLLLGTQELADLRPPGSEAMLEQVLGNLSALVAHRQVVPRSAQLIADVAGAHGVWRSSLHGDGRVTRTRASQALLDAGRIRRLGTGWAAVVSLADAPDVRVARVLGARPAGARPAGARPAKAVAR